MNDRKTANHMDPFNLSEAELENLDINQYVWQKYREKLLKRPRKKKYWERENEYYRRVIKVLEEIKTIRGALPQE